MMSTRMTRKQLQRCVIGLSLAVGLSACSAQYSNHGYIPPQEDLDQIKVGVDTRETLVEKAGVPAAGGVLNESGAFYVRSRFKTLGPMAPKVIERQVLAVSFDSRGVVSNVERFGLERGRVVPLERRVTSSGVTDTTFIRQLLGSIGRFNPAGLGS